MPPVQSAILFDVGRPPKWGPEHWPASASIRKRLSNIGQAYERFSSLHQPNEAVTEQDLIRPVLGLLGWTDYLPQQGAAGHKDVADHLLFADAASKARATARGNSDDRFQDALVVQESKRFGLALLRHLHHPTRAKSIYYIIS